MLKLERLFLVFFSKGGRSRWSTPIVNTSAGNKISTITRVTFPFAPILKAASSFQLQTEGPSHEKFTLPLVVEIIGSVLQNSL